MEKEIKSPNHSTIIKDIITTYIHEHKLNNTCILSKKAMFDDLKKSNADFDICLSSFYSHLNQLGIEEISSGHFDFKKESNFSMYSQIKYRKYNKFLCYQLVDNNQSVFIAKVLNNFFDKELFHCIALQDMLICFYYYSSQKKSLNRNNIKRKIKDTLNNLEISIKKKNSQKTPYAFIA